MEKKRIAIVGYGNIGRYALQALQAAPDLECAGVIRRNPSASRSVEGVKVAGCVEELGPVDAVILSVPSREVSRIAPAYLEKGISTVDSFDIHSQIAELRAALGPVAGAHGAVSIVSAGWDPGSDSVVRVLLEAMVPEGVTYTNFGPGRSMGHTVAVKAIPGVKDALSMTIPCGKGIHARHVYVELMPGHDFDAVAAAIKADPYFAGDDTTVELVPSVEAVQTLRHGVDLVRDGACSQVEGQHLDFNMSINNPALTAQMLVAAARAAFRQAPGCYVLPEIPVIDLLPGSREEAIKHLV